MLESPTDRILELSRQHPLLRASAVRQAGLSTALLSRLVSQGRLVRVGRGVYQNPEVDWAVQGAWAGMLTGSGLSVAGIILKQLVPDLSIAGLTVNGLHMATFSILVSIVCYVLVSLLTSKGSFNLDKLLHRRKYAIEGEHVIRNEKRSRIARILGVTDEFSSFDKVVYYGMTLWTVLWSVIFTVGTAYNLIYEVSSTAWKEWWGIHLGILLGATVIFTVWFTLGGIRDVFRLFKDLKKPSSDTDDDGWV